MDFQRVRLVLLILSTVVVVTAGTARGLTTTLSASGDTYVRGGQQNQNQNSDTFLRVQSSGPNRTLVRFTQAQIAAAIGGGTLVSATLELFIQFNQNNWGATGRTVSAHRITVDWTEAGATYNCPIDTNLANQQPDCATQWNGGTFVATETSHVLHTNGLSGYVQYTVTSDVAAFLVGTNNYGWLIKLTNEPQNGQVDYTSREGTAGQQPRLVLVYNAPTATPTRTPTSTSTLTPTRTPTRTVTPTPTSACGNSVVDAGEQCDVGAQNGQTTSCCTSACQFRSAGSTCRPSAGFCDVAETCTGSNGNCPADGFNTGLVCRVASTGEVCDQTESCNGSGPNCPPDGVKPLGTECRASAGICDVAETCDGVSKNCPADGFASAVVCRAVSAGDDCDEEESCNGGGPNCPNDAVKPLGTQCRAAAGVCDVAEVCNGSSKTCPADGFDTGMVCRAVSSGDVCDQAESCNGSGPNCPADAVKPSGTSCRASAGECDVADACDGSAKTCPPDAFKPNGTACTADGNPCTVDQCNGGGATCQHPAGNSGVVCRASAGQCDIAENCDGANAACPVNAFQPSGTACGSNSNTDCDNPDSCNGTGTCTVNNEPNGTSCSDGDQCTSSDSCAAGVCTGGINTCNILDHYKCYQGKDLKNPKFVKQDGVATTDQLVTNELVDVKKLKFVCTPVNKNGEGINNPNAHLACYQIKAPTFAVKPSVEVSSQFQPSRFELKKGKLLCLPATKTLLP